MDSKINTIIEATQKQILVADNFISQNVNVEYWQGHKNASEAVLDGFRAVGISVSEVVNQMPVIDPLVGIAQKAFVLLGEGSDIVSAFVTSELSKLLKIDESNISWKTPEWQKVQEIVRSLV